MGAFAPTGSVSILFFVCLFCFCLNVIILYLNAGTGNACALQKIAID